MTLQSFPMGMLNKKVISIVATAVTLTMGLTANPVFAKDKQRFTDYARVVHVEPAYRYVTVKVPQRVCTTQNNNRPHHQSRNNRHQVTSSTNGGRSSHSNSQHSNSTGATFIGAVIGGAIGHQVSRTVNGHGNTGATIAGAIIGSTLAHSTSESNRQQHRDSNQSTQDRHQRQRSTQQRCTTTTVKKRERRNDGFHVTYVYKGRSFNTQTNQHPGNRIAVQVAVSSGH